MNYRISIIYFINLNNFLKFLEKVKSDGTIVPVRITNRDESHGSIVPVRITNRDESLSALRRRTGHVPPIRPGWCPNRDEHSSRLNCPGWGTGTNEPNQPGQKGFFPLVLPCWIGSQPSGVDTESVHLNNICKMTFQVPLAFNGKGSNVLG